MELNLILISGALAAIAILVAVFFARRSESGEKSQQVSLGCGTLILIAVIVAGFSSPRVRDLESDVSKLQESVDQMQETLNSQTESIMEIRELIEAMQKPTDGAHEPAENDADPSGAEQEL
jgi:FtsZ-interacting cell division protein ZipA